MERGDGGAGRLGLGLDRHTHTLQGSGFFSGGPFFTPTISEINLLVPFGYDSTEPIEFFEKTAFIT